MGCCVQGSLNSQVIYKRRDRIGRQYNSMKVSEDHIHIDKPWFLVMAECSQNVLSFYKLIFGGQIKTSSLEEMFRTWGVYCLVFQIIFSLRALFFHKGGPYR